MPSSDKVNYTTGLGWKAECPRIVNGKNKQTSHQAMGRAKMKVEKDGKDPNTVSMVASEQTLDCDYYNSHINLSCSLAFHRFSYL